MVIYLRHDRHGTKVACGEAEAKADESHGWKRFDPSAEAAAAPSGEKVNALAPDSLEDLRQRWQAKFGREPHHRKSMETLKAEIEGG